MTKVTWAGHSFEVHPHSANWADVAGIYIFAGVTPENKWRAYYIGQADSFKSRLPNHERWLEAQRLGATHVHVMVAQQAAQRDSIEADLISRFQPRLNTQLR